MDKKLIRYLKTLSTCMVIVAMILAFLIAGIRIFGVQVYGVLTGSMEPTYPTGSLIYVKRVDASDLRVNDVITFSLSPNVIATHRIVEVVPDEDNPSIVRYRTKGDANNDVDASLVSASNIIGKAMFSVPQMGYIASYIQQPPGIYVAILVCGLMIAFVFYVDSLESKQKAASQRGSRRTYASRNRSQPQRPAQHRAHPRHNPYPRQAEYSRQREYPRQGSYSSQNESPRQSAYSRQRSYSQESEYPRQNGYQRQGSYSRQNEFPRQSGYPQQRSYPQRNEYPRQRTYPQRREDSQQREYSNLRDNRTGRE